MFVRNPGTIIKVGQKLVNRLPQEVQHILHTVHSVHVSFAKGWLLVVIAEQISD